MGCDCGGQGGSQDSGHWESKLFFEFVRILEECKPKYFLLENVKMKQEYQDIISEHLGVKPIEINSSLVSAQNRKRLYWTNIPNVTQPEDKRILLKDILIQPGTPYCYSTSGRGNGVVEFRESSNEKAHCLTATGYTNRSFSGVKYNGDTNKLLVEECERLQTVDEGYTKGISNTQRYKMLGNGWTVDVIAHIFKELKCLK